MAGKRVSHSEDWWANPPAQVLRCTANLKSTGQRCKREAAPGTNVCRNHGAALPAVQAAAARRIGMSVDDAVKRLLTMLDDPAVEARDKTKILHDLLDRGGLAATSKHLVGLAAVDPVEILFRDLLADPNATYDPRAAAPPALPTPDPAQAALDAAEDVPDWDTFRTRQIVADVVDVVDAEVLGDGDPTHTVSAVGSLSDRPPKWLADDLARLI